MQITAGGVDINCSGTIDLYARKVGVADTPFLASLIAVRQLALYFQMI